MILDVKTIDVSNVDPLNPNDIIDLCQKLDKPFIEDLYLQTFYSLKYKSPLNELIIRRYFSRLNLKTLRELTFQESYYEEPIKDIRYRITMERYVEHDISLNLGNIENLKKEEVNLDSNN